MPSRTTTSPTATVDVYELLARYELERGRSPEVDRKALETSNRSLQVNPNYYL